MKVQTRAVSAPLRQRDLTPQDYLEIVWRRKWWVVLPLIVGASVAYIMSLSLPPAYRSTTLILVEPQRVSTNYVSPTITSSVDDRLRTISQQILSRTNLTRIIKEFGLNKAENSPPTPTPPAQSGFVGRMKAKVKEQLISIGLYTPPAPVPLNQDEVSEGVVERMRKDIDVKVIGRDAFAITYSGTEPATVMRVANTLALLFIEENLKDRERQVEGTSEFLESQLQEAGRDLVRREQSLHDFKVRHRGALPGELDSHFRTLERLHQELHSINETITKNEIIMTEERKIALKMLEDERRALQLLMAPVSPAVGEESQGTSTVNPRVVALQQELARMRATFNDNYPDVVLLKRQIEELSQNPQPSSNGGEPSRSTGAPSTPQELPSLESLGLYTRVSPLSAGPMRGSGSQEPDGASLSITNPILSPRIAVLASELTALKAQRERIMQQSQGLEKRIAEIPANEEKLTEITRDYGASQSLYQTLLQKKLNAKISENLEKKQKSEQFRIVDPANLPTTPYKPNRSRIVGMGGVLGGGIGIGLVFLLNFINPTFRKPEDLDKFFDLPVLATIPRYKTPQGKHYKLVTIEDQGSFASEQYRILYTKINDLSKAQMHKVFAISSAIQGEGKTVTALNLAVVMAKDFGKRTLVLEGDFRRSSIPLYLNVELESGLVDILSSKTDIQSTIIPFADTLIPFADENLSVLPAVRRPENFSSLLSSQKMRHLFTMLRDLYDFILIDSPPVLPLSDMNIFEEVVDSIIMVVRAERTSQATLLKAVNALASEKVSGIVLNDVRQPFSLYYRYNYKYNYQSNGTNHSSR